MRKIIAILLSLLLLFPSCAAADGRAPEISAKRAVMLHSGGSLIYGKNQHERVPVASTTKLMTALIVIESCALDERVEIRAEHCTAEGSSMYLRPGEEYSVEELLKGLLLVSGNDAALALASHCSGSSQAFAREMNKRASELGMEDSCFLNPHGLPAEGHYSSAYDLALLMLECMKNSSFRSITGLKSCVIGENTLLNHNRLLRLLEGCTGGKTGFTESAGRCLVSNCEREGCSYVCVTLSDPDDWNDHINLYNWAYSCFEEKNVCEGCSFSLPCISGKKREAAVLCDKFYLPVLKGSKIEIRAQLPLFVFAPVRAGEKAGRAIIYINGKKTGECLLYYSESIPPSYIKN